MKPQKRDQKPAPARIFREGEQLIRFGDLALYRHSFAVRGPKGVIELSLGETRACALLIEAAGATVRSAELAATSGFEVRTSRHAVEQTISRLRSHLRRRGSTVAISATRRVGWRLVAGTEVRT